MEDSAKPRFYKARPVPYALREKVEAELVRLEKSGVIEKVQFSEWAAPVVPILKCDGSIRLCGDYKLTINRAAIVDPYPLPRIEDILSSIGNAKVFSKLDLANAYLQLALDEESKAYVTVSTHRGLLRHNRLPFGVHVFRPCRLSAHNGNTVRRHTQSVRLHRRLVGVGGIGGGTLKNIGKGVDTSPRGRPEAQEI